jgi:hypothetical protein
VRYEETYIAMVSAITCKNMFRHPQIHIAHFVSLWGTMIVIVGPIISCTKGQETYTKFKVKCNKKETLPSITLQEEETSILIVDSDEEEEEEAWVEAEDRSSVITAHNQDTWQGTIRTLALLATIATPLSMLLKNVQHC